MTTKLRSVEEAVQTLYERTSYFLAGFYRNWKRMKELIDENEIEERAGYDAMMFSSELRHALTTDRATIAAVLIEGLERKHVREMQPGENRAKYLAFVRGEEHMKKKAIALIRTTLDVTSEEK